MSFDNFARWYQTLERIAFGNSLQRSRVACLDQILTPKRVLIIGEGDGRFLLELLRIHPAIDIDCVDSSERMLQLARRRVEKELGNSGKNVRWFCQDLMLWDPSKNSYDLIVTHFVLDCFPAHQVGVVVQKLKNAATDSADWLFADFRMPTTGLARIHSLVWLKAMYLFFRVTTGITADQLIDATPFLEREGFQLVQRHLFRWGMLRSEIWRRL